MTDVSRYATDRLTALYDRTESLEHAVEAAGAILEAGIARQSIEIDARLALAVLKGAIVQEFRQALLATRETTDDQLDMWLKEADTVTA